MRTAAEVLVHGLRDYGVPFAAGIPGHGNWAITDAFADRAKAPRFVQVTHEQTAAHMADACFRLTGVPGAAVASIGPGAANLLMGLATAFADSSAFLALTGSSAIGMRGHGVMQSLDRKYSPDFPRLAEPATKAVFDVVAADASASILHRAFNMLLSGRPGPVGIDLPLDVQVTQTKIPSQPLKSRRPGGRQRGDAGELEKALKLILAAKRPCIVAGGGVISADASDALARFAQAACIPVVFTWNGKGAIAEDHPLCVGPIGVGGSRAANAVASSSDVLLALGCRFSDWSSSSFRRGVTYSIPSTKLIHIDVDPREIGRTYPVEVGIVADVGSAVEDMNAALSRAQAASAQQARASYLDEIAGAMSRWQSLLQRRRSDSMPATMLGALGHLRDALPREAVVTVGSGHCQAAVRQAFPVYAPRTHVTSGGYSAMGFAVPAAMASAIVNPGIPSVAIVGDGDMLMSIHDLATCAMHSLPVICIVLNNSGFLSIRDGQNALFGRSVAAAFERPTHGGARYSPDFVGLARSFGLDVAMRVDRLDAFATAIGRAIAHGGPALVEVPITEDVSISGAEPAGWWDFPPGPRATPDIVKDHAAGARVQQHLGADTEGWSLEPPLGIYG